MKVVFEKFAVALFEAIITTQGRGLFLNK